MADPLLRVTELSKTYNLNETPDLRVHALRGVSFEVYPGEFVCVVGESGSGKSTLLHCIGSFEEPDLGCEESVQYQRDSRFESIWSDPRWYRQNFVGVVFQAFHLLPNLRVWQNVELPLKLRRCRAFEPESKKRREIVDSALEQLGVLDKGKSRVNEISGGQCQRVAIARALVKGPSLILADEPTGNLDAKTTEMIVEELRRLAHKDVAVLMVTHNLAIARRYADRIITLADGGVVAQEALPQSRTREKLVPVGLAPQEPALASALQSVDNREVRLISPETSQERTVGDHGDADHVLAHRRRQPPEAVPVATARGGHVSDDVCEPSVHEPTRATRASVSTQADIQQPSDSVVNDHSVARWARLAAAWGRRGTSVIARTARAARGRLGMIQLPGGDMRIRDVLGLAIRDARESYASLVTNIVAILFGAAVSALLLGLVFGANRIMAVVLSGIPNIEAVNVWIDYSTGETPITQAEFDSLRQLPGVRAVVPEIKQLVFLYAGEPKDYIACLASTEPGDPEVGRLSLVKGSRDVDPVGWDVVLDEQVAYELDHFDPHGLVGKQVTIELRRYDTLSSPDKATPSKVLKFPVKVIGVVKFSPSRRVYASMNLVRFARDYAMMRSEYVPEPGARIDAARISPRTFYEGAKVFFANPRRAEESFMAMKKQLGKRFEVNWPGEEYLWLRDVQLIAFIVFMGFGLLTVIAGSISVFNTLRASVTRKTREIGIFRALGVSRLQVFILFLLQSALIGLVAGIGGLAISYGFAPVANAAIGSIAREQWKLTKVDLSSLLILPAPVGAGILLMVVVICVAAAFFPSWRATRVTPMDAIRATGI